MNHIVRIGITALVALVPTVVPAQRAADAEAECYKLVGHVSARECLGRHEAESATLVEKAERDLLVSLRQESKDPGDASRAVEALDLSARQYKLYRKSQCDLVASLALGGNSATDRRLLCQIDLDKRRVADLTRELHHGI